MAVKQTEYQWVYLFATVSPVTGQSSAMLAPYVGTLYMNEHLRFISKKAAKGVHLVLVMDQADWQTAKKLKVPQNVMLLHLPPKSPEPSPAERIWRYLPGNYLSNRRYTDCDHLFQCTAEPSNRLDPTTLASITSTE